MSTVQFRAERLSKRFINRWVFRDLDLQLLHGQSLVVAGRNGSGKSTLLKVVAGLLPCTEGHISIEADGPPRNRIGLASPEQSLYGPLSGEENLRFFALLRGLRDVDVAAALEEVGLDGRGGDRVDTYSTGMKQRLRLAAATIHHPPVLLLDEPGSGLDETGRKVIDDVVNRQRERGITLVATNDPAEYRYGEFRLELGV